jgi:hypothetical protein
LSSDAVSGRLPALPDFSSATASSAFEHDDLQGRGG